MNAGELGLKIGFDGNDALAGINNLITKFAILRASALQIIDTFEALGKATIGEGVALKNFAEFTGISSENIQKMGLFAEKLGVSADEVKNKFGALNQELNKIKYGGESALTGIATTYGIDITSFNAETVMGNIAKRYNELLKSGQKAFAQNMLNSLGMANIAPLLRKYGEAQGYEIQVLDDEQLGNLQEAKNALTEFWQIITQSQKGIFADWAGKLADGFKNLNEVLRDFDKETLGYITTSFEVLGSVALLSGVKGLAKAVLGIGGAASSSLGFVASLKAGLMGLTAYGTYKSGIGQELGNWLAVQLGESESMKESRRFAQLGYSVARGDALPKVESLFQDNLNNNTPVLNEEYLTDRNIQNINNSSDNSVVNNSTSTINNVVVVDPQGNPVDISQIPLKEDLDNFILSLNFSEGGIR